MPPPSLYTSIQRCQALLEKHPSVESVKIHKADKQCDRRITCSKSLRALGGHQAPFDLMVTLSPNAATGATGKRFTFGVTVSGIDKELLAVWVAPGSGCDLEVKDAIRRILIDVTEIGHIREPAHKSWWTDSGVAATWREE